MSEGRHGRLGAAMWLALAIVLGLSEPPAALAADPVAVFTEIRPGKGEIRVKRAEDSDWTVPRALQALRAGDQVRATADGRAARSSRCPPRA